MTGMKYYTATLEKSLYKIKCTLTIRLSNPTPKYYPIEIKQYIYAITCTLKVIADLLIIIKNRKDSNLEAPNILQLVMYKQTVINPSNGRLPNKKGKKALGATVWRAQLY